MRVLVVAATDAEVEPLHGRPVDIAQSAAAWLGRVKECSCRDEHAGEWIIRALLYRISIVVSDDRHKLTLDALLAQLEGDWTGSPESQ